MSLRLGTRAKADAGDAIAALDGNAVRGEGPLVAQRTTGALVHAGLAADALVTEHGLVGVDEGLNVRSGLLVDPRGEVSLGLVDLAGPGRTVVHVHGDLHVVAVLLGGRQVADLVQAGLPGLAGGHATVDGDGAGVSDSAAAGAGVEDLADGAGAAAQEAGVLVVLGVVLGVEHLDEALDVGRLVAAVVVEGADVGDDVGHLVDGIVAAVGGRAVAGGAVNVDADLHAAAVTAIDAAVGGLGGNDELGLNAVLVVDVLPAHAVAVLFLDGANDHDLVALGDEAHVLHHLGSVGSRSHAALLIGAAAAIDDLVGLVALIGIGIPVLDVADANGVDVGIDGDDLVALAHKAHDVAQAVDLDLVIAKALHLGLDASDNLALLARLRGMGDHGAQEASHISTMGLSSSLDSVEIEFFSHCS